VHLILLRVRLLHDPDDGGRRLRKPKRFSL